MAQARFQAECSCGKLAYHLDETGANTRTRFICYCNSCRAADLYIRGDASGLSAGQGVEIIHASPYALKIDQGAEHLAAFQLNEKGPVRWYAKCCNTPVWNTIRHPKIPFFGLVISPRDSDQAAQMLPRLDQVYTKYAAEGSTAPDKDRGFAHVAFMTFADIARDLAIRKSNALRNTNGKFLVDVQVLNQDERREAYRQAKHIKA